jgi:predicted MPP superfamily phosphohydrolase
MQIQFVSDIHLDVRPSYKLEKLGDILILAGDIGQPGQPNYRSFLESLTDYKQVLLVSGNHEYYSSKKRKTEIDLQLDQLATSLSNVTYLHMSCLDLGPGLPIVLGTTLWTNIKNKAAAQLTISDYSRIRVGQAGQRKFKPSPDDTVKWHKQELSWLVGKLQQLSTENPGKPIIVVTHHSPTFASCDAYAALHPNEGRHCDDAFATDLESLILQYRPLAWIHGHTHCRLDHLVVETRVLCSPVGYPSEINLCQNGNVFEV